jgi:hypothetical protein
MKCSVRLAILLEITANLYVHRREIRHSKRGQARRQRRQRRQATERPNRLRRQHGERTGSVGCVWLRMATKGVKRRQIKSAVEAVGPPLAWGAYYKGLAAQQISFLCVFFQRRAIYQRLFYNLRNVAKEISSAEAWIEEGPPWFPLLMRHIERS